MSSCPVVTVSIAVIAVGVALYIAWPSPPFSENLKKWMNHESSYFTARGRKLFFKDSHGKGKLVKSDTLLLLHGFPTFSYDWVKMWPALTENFHRVIAVDFLGFGLSDKPLGHNYTIMEQADLVSDLLRAMKVKDVHLLSHDYGDSVAQELLHRHNHAETAFSIKTACLLNGGMFKETNFPLPLQRILSGHRLFGSLLARLSNRYIFRAGLSQVYGPNTQPTADEMQDLWCGYRYNNGYLNSAEILGYIAERGRHNMRWRQALQNSLAPIHVIYGPKDPVNPPAFVDFYKREIPKGTIDVLADDISHYPQWEDSDNVTKLYLQFVASKQP